MKNSNCCVGVSIWLAITVCVLIMLVASTDAGAEDFGYDGAEMASEVGNMELRISEWKHEWFHGLGSGTEFNGKGFVINKNTGQIYAWNLIETAAHNICNIPSDSKHYYKKFVDAQYGNFGFGNIKGESQHVSALLRFYSGKGSVWWRVKSEDCP